MTRLVFLAAGLLMIASPVAAQNTAGVFPPGVNEGHRSFQYRAAIDPDNSSGGTGFAQRLHYQQALNTELMWRIVGQTRKTAESDIDFDFVQAELFWELTPDHAEHQMGLRFDLRVRDGDRPEQIGLNWTNAFKLRDGWSARAILLTSVQVGDRAADGINLQTRAQLARRLAGGQTVGLEMYNNYGNTGDIGGFNDQNHAIGPYISASPGKRWSLFAGPLFGLSDGAPDFEFRLWVTRSL